MSKIAGITAPLAQEKFTETSIANKIRIFHTVVEQAKETADEEGGESDEAWKDVYDSVFGGTIGKAQEAIFQQAGLVLRGYADPDTTYKEDAMEFIGAVTNMTEAYLAGHDQIMRELQQ